MTTKGHMADPGGDINIEALAGELGIRPLNARSVILSVLLGTHPPLLPVSALLTVAGLFDIAPGAVRTALSRMVTAGELTADDGRYQLTGRMLRRQQDQDRGRTAPPPEWDGQWWTAVVLADRRTTAERRRFRSAMEGLRMGELRPDVWLRPANIDGPTGEVELLVTRGELSTGDPAQLAGTLWDLAAIEGRASLLEAALQDADRRLTRARNASLAPTFVISAACVQFLRAEPQLPTELASMPASRRLRTDYDAFADRFATALQDLLKRSHSDASADA